jgi:hypothetical protein
MSKIEHTYIPLDNATTIMRRHQREVQPPGMVNIENFIPSRSDASISLRPDWWYTTDIIYGASGLVSLPSTSILRDVLNSANGLYGSNQLTYFTTFIPYGIDNGVWRILSGTHGVGTVTADDGQSVVTGTDTAFLEFAHRGAIIAIPQGALGDFGGGPHFFTEGATTNEWYLTELDLTELALVGDELVYLEDKSLYAGKNYKINDLGSFSGVNKANIGDADSLGFTAFYLRMDTRDPRSAGGEDKNICLVRTALNISGSNHKWSTSISGTNEYYYVERDDSAPTFNISGIQTDSIRYKRGSYYETYTPPSPRYYSKNTTGTDLSDQSLDAASVTLVNGTIGSLANLETGYGDNDTLSFSTVYIRDNTGSPDATRSSRSPASVVVTAYLNGNKSGYKWVQSDVDDDFYKFVTTAGGDPGVPEPSLVLQFNDATFTGVPNYVREQDPPYSWYPVYAYGDFDDDGFNTVYYYPSHGGDPDVLNWKPRIYFEQELYGSSYGWVASSGGTNEYYLADQAEAEIAADFVEPFLVSVGGYSPTSSNSARGTIGSLADGQWGFGKNAADSLTYDTIYVRWDDGDPDTEELSIVAHYDHNVYASMYKWVESSTSNEWYIVNSSDAGDPNVGEPTNIVVDTVSYTEGTVGSLAADEYDYGDNDTLGFNTIYIYSTTDPNGAVGTGIRDEVAPKIISSEADSTESDYYLIDRIESDTSLSVYGEIQTPVSGVAPTIYYNHNPFLAEYKLNIQAYTSGLIYCGPTIRDDMSEEDICGPFYADLLAGEWAYGGTIYSDTAFVGSGVLFEKQPSLATNSLSYIQIFPTVDDVGDNSQPTSNFLAYAPSINTNGAWSKKTFGTDVTITGDGTSMRLNSIQAVGSTYICAAQVIGGGACYPGIAYSTSPHLGLTWATAAITSVGGNNTAWTDPTGAVRPDDGYQAICAAWNGQSPGRIVCLVWTTVGGSVYAVYSDDSGATWSACGGDAGNFSTSQLEAYPKVYYLNGQFIIISDFDIFYGDGSTLTQVVIDAAATSYFRDVAFNGDERWVAIKSDFTAWYTDDITGTWTEVSLPLDFTYYTDETSFIKWDSVGERFVANSAFAVFWSDDGEEWKTAAIDSFGKREAVKLPTNLISDSSGVSCVLYDGGADFLRSLTLSRFNYSYWNVVDFIPLSDIYRASTFSVLDGYVVLGGLREYDEDANDGAGEWTYYPRRIRWTAPATYNDFSSTGSGTADLNGEGAILDSRPVNGRIVLFETSRCGAIVPRGDVTDPWDYDVVKEDFRILSNPITVDDMCYVISTDGLIWATDGINVTEVGSSFDATMFDDFDEKKPYVLDYSRQLNCLIVYRFDSTETEHKAYFISLSSGSVTSIVLPVLSDSGAFGEDPAFICAVSDSSDQRVIVSFHPFSAANDAINTTYLAAGRQIIGKDTPLAGSTNDNYWSGEFETGEIYLTKEGEKTSLKHLIVRTYSGSSDGEGTNRPRIVVFYRSLEDTEWRVAGYADASESTATMTNAAMTDDAGVWSAYIGAGDDSTVDFNLPTGLDGAKVDVYLKAGSTYTKQTYGTDYTIPVPANAYAIQFTTAPTSSQTVYYGWNNKPEIVMATGDFWEAPDGLHRVTSITDHGALVLDHYGTTTYTGAAGQLSHYPSAQIPDGDGEVKIGLRGLVEGVRFKIMIVPEYNTSDCPTTVKVTGITIGHSPMGRKILSATGS